MRELKVAPIVHIDRRIKKDLYNWMIKGLVNYL